MRNRFIYFRSIVLSIIAVIAFWECASPPPLPDPDPIPIVPPLLPVVIEVEALPPQALSIRSVIYDHKKMVVAWESYSETDFKRYSLIQLVDSDSKVLDTLAQTSNPMDTVFTLTEFDPTNKNWFWVVVTNASNLSTEGDRATHKLETDPPQISELFPVQYDNGLTVSWEKNIESDFKYYNIYRSRLSDMSNKEQIAVLDYRYDTTFVLETDHYYYYQIGVQDCWGLESFSNVTEGDHTVILWNNEYSVIKTTQIDKSSSQLFGEIPVDIGQLLNLQVLKLHINFLSGEIPNELWGLKKLKILNLSENQLSGELSRRIKDLKGLKELWLGDNNFSGSLREDIGSLKNLTHLNISENNIEGHLPWLLGDLDSLVYLNLWKNKISGIVPIEIGALKSLEFINLSENQLRGRIPKEIGQMKSLKSISLFNNQLVGGIPFEISELPDLIYLSLYKNKLEGYVPDNLLKYPQLTYLRLDQNNLTNVNYDLICSSGYNWSDPIFFSLSDNQFKRSLPVCNSNRNEILIQKK